MIESGTHSSQLDTARLWRVLRPVAATVALVAMIVASAYVSVPLPVGPVPMTMQSLAVLLAGVWAGPRIGAAACVAYLGLGLAGLPVFAGGAVAPGLAVLAKPSFGYLLGFIGGAWIAGLVFPRIASRTLGALAAFSLGHVVIFAGGLAYLTAFMPVSQAITVGLLPFVAGTVVKTLLGVALVVAGTGLRKAR